ncbi:MAG: CAP domain-containing protein [Lachnospiraceae bacterium]|nr:CAP domain-containing protein [Acutalibacteraceae bacterium]
MRKFLATLLTGVIAASSVATAGAANSDSFIYGDVNNDKKVSMVDAVLIMRNTLGLNDLSADAAVQADVDGDGSVTIKDSIYVLRYICGFLDTFPVEEGPAQKPTEAPTAAPTERPTQKPTEAPTAAPTEKPTQKPTEAPTAAPTEKPTQKPTEVPAELPTNSCNSIYDADTEKDCYTLSYKVFEIVNQERIKAGVKPLKFNNDMYKAAMVRAKECDESFSHDRPNGTSCFTALKEAGVKYFSAGENIAMGYRTPADVMKGWMDSEGHRNNILDPDFTDFACGVYKSGYWSQFFCKI